MGRKIILSSEQEYQEVQAQLNARKKPSRTLRYMMQALENYRQAKKMGWSRSWNKYHVVNFQSFKLNSGDQDLCRQTLDIIGAEIPAIPEPAAKFISELLLDNKPPMGFLFFQEFSDKDRKYEGVVVSYGRVNAENRRFRDRLDLILESEVIDGISQGLSRIRFYVDPYLGVKEPLWQITLESAFQPKTHAFFEQLAGLSWAWATDQDRLWSHWVTEYIDYFGDRHWPMKKSYFYLSANPERRIGQTNMANNLNGSKAA